jgi:hypothetical protein
MRIFPTKRTVKRWATGAAILVAIALIANGFMAWLTEHRLQTRIAAIRAAGDPASIADLAPKPIPDDQNAAFYLEQLKPQLDAFAADHVRFLDRAELGKAYESAHDRGYPPTPEQIAAIRTILEKYPEIDRGLATAAACDQYASRADFSLDQPTFIDVLIKRVTDIRTAARFNDWRTAVMIAEGKSQQAAQVGLESLRIARLHDSEPLLINYLVSVALSSLAIQDLYDALAAGPISPQLHAAIDEELVKHDDPQRMARVLTTERAYAISTLDPWLGEANRFIVGFIGWPIKQYYIGILDAYVDQLDMATNPWYEMRNQFVKRGANSRPTGHGVLADLAIPALDAAYQSNARNLALVRSLRIFNALRLHAEENGHEAQGLNDLPLPKEATIDPFSGEPLKLKHTDDGWIVYSVMENGVDDDGDFIGLKDYGVAPPRYRMTQKPEPSAAESAPSTDQ